MCECVCLWGVQTGIHRPPIQAQNLHRETIINQHFVLNDFNPTSRPAPPLGHRHRPVLYCFCLVAAVSQAVAETTAWLPERVGLGVRAHTHTHSHPTFLLFEMMQKNQGVTSLLPPCLLASVTELPFRFRVDSQSCNPHRRFVPWLAGGLLQGLFQCARVVRRSILSAPNACTGSTVPRASAPVPSSLDLETVSYQRTSWRGSEVACLALSRVKWPSGK